MTAQKLAPVPLLLTALLLLGCSAPPKEESVNPGINVDYLDPDLNIESMVRSYEDESREIAALRNVITDAVGIRSGMTVADIGAGTGLFMESFAQSVGPDGKVYAVEISPAFVKHMRNRAENLGLNQVTTVLCTERSVELPANSVNVAFLCDVYHHFEYPRSTMATIHEALRPGGTLVVIDFNRDPDAHLRARKSVFTGEIVEAGFELVEEVAIEGLTNYYFLRFRKN